MFKQLVVGLLLLCLSQHAQANKVQIDKVQPAKTLRIVALAPHIVENLYAIGAGDNIVGTVDYADYPAAAKGITRIGGYYGISIEKLLVLKPDIVIAWKSGNQSDDLAQIERLGIKLYLTDPTTITGIADELLMLGKLTGNIKKSEQVVKVS